MNKVLNISTCSPNHPKSNQDPSPFNQHGLDSRTDLRIGETFLSLNRRVTGYSEKGAKKVEAKTAALMLDTPKSVCAQGA